MAKANKGNRKSEQARKKQAKAQQHAAANVHKCHKCKKVLGPGGMKDHKCTM